MVPKSDDWAEEMLGAVISDSAEITGIEYLRLNQHLRADTDLTLFLTF